MAKDDLAQLDGKVVDALAGGLYKVELDNKVVINAKLCGKMRRFNIRVVVGDRALRSSRVWSVRGLVVHECGAGLPTWVSGRTDRAVVSKSSDRVVAVERAAFDAV